LPGTAWQLRSDRRAIRADHRDRSLGDHERNCGGGAGQHVEVNVSVQTIATDDLIALVERQLRDAGADPSNLVLEITDGTDE
jgi:EAL domain-containing protein (putative c-di-GMP-specific phosphodiesterase class I)